MPVNGLPTVMSSAPEAQPSKDGTCAREEQLALMLDLFSAQMDAAVQEADDAVENLTQALDGLLKSSANQAGAEIARHTHDAVVAMQFYDRMSQRLGHVRYSLSTLAMFMCDPIRSGQLAGWERLRTTLRKLYSNEEERALFELMILDGKSGDEARERAASRQRIPAESRIELF